MFSKRDKMPVVADFTPFRAKENMESDTVGCYRSELKTYCWKSPVVSATSKDWRNAPLTLLSVIPIGKL